MSTGTEPAPAARGSAPPVRSLAEDLRRRDDGTLARLLHERPDLVTPVPTDLTRLAERATTRSSIAWVIDRLDRLSLQVLEALAVLPTPAAYAELAPLLGVDDTVLRPVLQRLRELALVWGDLDAPHLVSTAGDLLGPSPAGLGPPVAVVLRGLSPQRIDDLATAVGVTAGEVVDALAHPERLAALLADAGDEARAALAGMAWGPPTGRIAEALRAVAPDTARTPVERLLARGLLLPVAHDTVVLPREVALVLRGGRLHEALAASPPAPATTVRDPSLVDRAAAGAAAELVRRVERLLEAWAEQPAVALRAGGLGVRELRRTAVAVELDESATALLAEIAQAAGLLGHGGGIDDGWLPSPAYDAWRRQDVAHRWAVLALAWLGSTRAAFLVTGARGDRDRPAAALGPDLERPGLSDVRRQVLAALDTAGPGAALGADGVREVLAWRRPRRAGSARDAMVGATLSEAADLGVTGMGALSAPGRALGAAPAGVAPGEPAWVAAVDDVAAAIAPLLPPPLDHVVLQADLTAVAPGPLQDGLARDLGLVADVESTGGATVYRFSAGSVRRALDAGRSAGEVLDLLARASRTPVPQPLSYLVEDVARRHGRLRVGAAGSFVRSDDPAALAELAADPRAVGLGLRRLAPTVLAAEVGPDSLLTRLRDLGHAPAAEAADGTLVLARRADRRAPARPAPRPYTVDRPVPGPALLAAAVRALRAGDRSAERRPAGEVVGRLGRTGSTEVLAVLRAATTSGQPVWIGYVDRDGGLSERVVDPVAVAGGWLTAYDHRSEQVRTFAVHRISGVAPVDH